MSDTVDPELKEEVDKLYASLTAEWHDLPICVILIGKIESLLIQSIVADIITKSEYDKDKIRARLLLLLEDDANDFNDKEDSLVKQIEVLIVEITNVNSQNYKFSDIMRENARTSAIMDKSRYRSHLWFENEHCGKVAKDGLVLPPSATRAEAVNALKTQCRGLIHEVISVMTEYQYDKLLFNVPFSIRDRIGRVKLDKHRTIRNAVVHKRTSHRFLDDDERWKFIQTYADVVSCCVVKHDCFLLASDEEKEKKKTEYMEPEAHFTLVQKMIFDYNKAIEENLKQMKETMDKEKKREIEKATNEIHEELNAEVNRYKDLLDEVNEAQKVVEESGNIAKQEIEKIEKYIEGDEDRTSFEEVVKSIKDVGVALGDIQTHVRKIGKERRMVQPSLEGNAKSKDIAGPSNSVPEVKPKELSDLQSLQTAESSKDGNCKKQKRKKPNWRKFDL